MKFGIADTFPKALRKLDGQEQKAAKITVFDVQQDPANPGLQFHRIENSKDPNFWSIRAGRDIRIIIHKTKDSFLVCYVGHHDDAYAWAERRRIESHPKTGAAQIVQVHERVEEITTYKEVAAEPPAPSGPRAEPLFASRSDDDLLGFGVPEDWLDEVKKATEDTLLDIADHLPEEAAEALLSLAVGETPVAASYAATPSAPHPLEHPDAQRRFRVMEDIEELKRALDYPWDQWTVFLHPSQKEVVDETFDGPARVFGTAGTGKTVVAIHRVAKLLREHDDPKVLLTTFSKPLANSLEKKLKILVGENNDFRSKVTILPFREVARDLFTLATGYEPQVAKPAQISSFLAKMAIETGLKDFSLRFLNSEWSNVVDAWQIETIDAYKNVPRLGRQNRMSTSKREAIWPVFEGLREKLKEQHLLTWPEVFKAAEEHFSKQPSKPFTHLVVDEAQDLGVPDLKLFANIVESEGSDRLFFAGDLGQRIFQQPFSWKVLGVDISDRERRLSVNYRTSHQIKEATDKLMPATIRDVDGNQEDRTGTVSVFNGPSPEIEIFSDPVAEQEGIAVWLKGRLESGISPNEIGLFVRTSKELPRVREALKLSEIEPMELSERAEDPAGRVSIGAMPLAKGLEFKAVVVMACDDEVLPLQERIAAVADENELDEVYDTERHLFYVAGTRARDQLLITGVEPGSEFLNDFN